MNISPIKLFFQSIKNDNITYFKSYLNDLNPILLKENFKSYLLYALECNSSNILNYLFNEKKEDTLTYMQNFNNKNLDFLSFSLYSKNFFEVATNLKKYCSKDIFSTIISPHSVFHAITRLNEENWNLFYSFDEESIIKQLTFSFPLNSDNFQYLIPRFNKPFHLSLLKHIPETSLNYIDDVGFTPFLTACKYSNLPFVEKLLPNSALKSKFNDGINCLSLSCFNPDINVLKYLITNIKSAEISLNDVCDISPLYIAISERMEDKSLYLIHELFDDVSQAFIDLSKHLKTKGSHSLLSNIVKDLKEEHIQSLIEDPEKSSEFWSNIFLHLYSDDIENILKNPYLKKSFSLLSQHPEYSHFLYNSSLIGKKDINSKINLLLSNLPILTSDNSDEFFKGKIINNELNFTLKNYSNNFKPMKNFSLATSLMNLPTNQIKGLLDSTELKNYLSPNDFLVLYSIGLYKKSLSFMKYIKNNFLNKFPNIKPEYQNTNDFIQNLLMLAQDKPEQSIFNLRFKNKYAEIISCFENSPSNLLSKISFNILSNNEKSGLKDLETINQLFLNNKYFISSFNNSVLAFLLQSETVSPEFLSYFKKYQNNISKVCFAKLINFEKIYNFGEKNIARILEIPFIDPSEDSVLSEIDLNSDANSIFTNIYSYENVKTNEIFDVFKQHQIKNITSNKYNKKLIKHYNLRNWTMLFSILNSANPNSSDFIIPFLDITNFNIETFKTIDKNISVNNFKTISHHFYLPNDFWTKLFEYYPLKKDDSKSLLNHSFCHMLFLNHLSNCSNNSDIDLQLLTSKSIDFLTSNNLLKSRDFFKLIQNTFNSPNSIFCLKQHLSILSESDLIQLGNQCLENNNFAHLNIFIEHNPNILNNLSYTNLFNNNHFMKNISSSFFNIFYNNVFKSSSKTDQHKFLTSVQTFKFDENSLTINDFLNHLNNNFKSFDSSFLISNFFIKLFQINFYDNHLPELFNLINNNISSMPIIEDMNTRKGFLEEFCTMCETIIDKNPSFISILNDSKILEEHKPALSDVILNLFREDDLLKKINYDNTNIKIKIRKKI